MNLANWVRILARLEREPAYADDPDETPLSERIAKAKTYVDNRLYRADDVPVLPASAPRGYFLVTAGDTNLYVGTGVGNALRKIPTQAVLP